MEKKTLINWDHPFIIYRISESGAWWEVFHHNELQRAKYWLTYIAEAGDVLCRTPAHIKHPPEKETPEYVTHKLKSGKIATNYDDWRAMAVAKGVTGDFPTEQLVWFKE